MSFSRTALSSFSTAARQRTSQNALRYREFARRGYSYVASRDSVVSRTQNPTIAVGMWLNGRSRQLHSSSIREHGQVTRPAPGTGITVHFKDSKGNLLKTIQGNEGDDILSLAHEYDIDLEGACEGSVACSTCHVIISPNHYDLLPEPEDDENDMLDMAFGLTDTSRLGCQVRLTKELDGMTCTLPSATRNMFVDGKKPTHH
ncbi:2Fe-2S ferredoxin-type domain-containing protein [Irpex rosettiformis]|uniref:2Fe-2S ferredoxin-type domain-containing protein n=1 Tax=Irpex rosettiformis TaxID=378272 RepID=A0ACB8U2E5_9APHY|nr:2Fe-2S ferredoxin-type domain-containing protein [Irpex rosettiformis]